MHPGSTAAAIRAGIVLLPEDRKSDGVLPNLSVRENIVLAALSQVSRGGIMSAAKQDKIVNYTTPTDCGSRPTALSRRSASFPVVTSRR